MNSWYSIFPKNPWMSIYAWVIFCLLPFFFIFRSSSPIEIAVGISLLFLFFLSYRFSFKSNSGLVYMWISFEIVINIAMTLLFGYVYLSHLHRLFSSGISAIQSVISSFMGFILHLRSVPYWLVFSSKLTYSFRNSISF